MPTLNAKSHSLSIFMRTYLRKMLYLFVFVVVFVVCGAFYVASPILGKLPDSPKTEIEVDSTILRKDVVYLADSCFPRNFYNQKMLNKAADYIQERLEGLGYETALQQYKAQKVPHKNVIARIGPKTEEIVVVGAHYDVCGDQAGADDNASAVAGLLALAKLFKKHEAQLKYQIELVAYSLEEPPFFRTPQMGSAVHAKSLRDANRKVKAMVCLEMIGYFSDEPKSQSYPLGVLKTIYPSKGNFIAVVGKLGEGKITRHFKKYMKSGSTLPVAAISAPATMVGIDFSDHQNYWKNDYPAVMITDTSFFRNHNYHKTSDTPDTLDYTRMAEVVKGVFWGIVNL